MIQAARREALEGAGVPAAAPLYALRTHDTVPVSSFAARDQFACDLTGVDIVLSHEHTDVRRVRVDEALALLRYDSTRTPSGSLRSGFDKTISRAVR